MYWDSLGGRIRRARKVKGIKQETLGRLIGRTQVAISNYEQGKNEPDFRTIADIAAVLGTTPHELLGIPTPSPVLGSNALPVSFVPVVLSLTPQGPLRGPDNIKTYAPFLEERNDVIGYELPNVTSFYKVGDILFLSPKDTYTSEDQVLYLQDGRAVVSTYSEVPSALVPYIAGMVVGYYRAV